MPYDWHDLKFSIYSNDMLLTALMLLIVTNVDVDTSNEENSAIIISFTAIASMATKTLEKLALKCHLQKAIQILECLGLPEDPPANKVKISLSASEACFYLEDARFHSEIERQYDEKGSPMTSETCKMSKC